MSPVNDLRRLIGRLRLRHLELLSALGEDANLGRCARRLNMTQPTASKLLREIEDIYGVPLFVRNRRGLAPTAAGQAMTRRAVILLAETAAAHAELQATERGATGRLRLGVFPVAVSGFLAHFCQALRTEWPNIVLSIDEGIEQRLIGELAAGRLDLVFGRVVVELLTPDLRHEALYREPTVVVCGVQHPILRDGPEGLDTHLRQAQWMLPASDGPVYNVVSARLSERGLAPPQVVHETTSVFVTLEMLEHSSLLSILPESTALDYARIGKVALVPTAPLSSGYAVGLVHRVEGMANPTLVAALTAARKAAGLHRPTSIW